MNHERSKINIQDLSTSVRVIATRLRELHGSRLGDGYHSIRLAGEDGVGDICVKVEYGSGHEIRAMNSCRLAITDGEIIEFALGPELGVAYGRFGVKGCGIGGRAC